MFLILGDGRFGNLNLHDVLKQGTWRETLQGKSCH